MNENKTYPFSDYIAEDKSKYAHAKDKGFIDPDDDFLIGESGGFLLNIVPGVKFINTHLLFEIADYYRANKCYTKYKLDSVPHKQLRKREQIRRKKGFSAPCRILPNGKIKEIRITGSHYNFLNYTRIEQLDEETIKAGSNSNTAEKFYDFSKFIDAQYWTFKIMEFCENNGFHLLIDKTRRGGFSYIMAADTANTINAYKKKVVIHVAKLSNYLTDTGGLTDFSTNNLNFYENNSPFKRGVFSSIKENFKLGYKQSNNLEADDSWGSALLSVSANTNANCAIGKDAKKVKVEEVSTMNNFNEFMDVTEPAMRTGAYTTGCLMAWGTATSGDMQMFSQNFYDPKEYNFMPFENVWDDDSRHEICGYFKPYCWGLQGELDGIKAMDKDGNSNIHIALKISEKERAVKKEASTSYAKYLNYLGQYANKPSESFSSAAENIFSSEELTAWGDRLNTDSSFKFYTDGQLIEGIDSRIIFKSNERLIIEGGKFNKNVFDYIQGVPRKGHEHPHGCIRRWFAPQTIKMLGKDNIFREQVPEKLYSISYDPVGINKDNKELTLRHSHNSIKVWMNPHELNGFKPKLVAVYYGRPDTLEEADKICLLLAKYYNCIGTTGVEVNRGETVSNFTKWKSLKYLEREPVNVWDASIKGKTEGNYGYVIADGQRKLDALRLLNEMLKTDIGKDEIGNPIKFFHTIYDYQTILELKMWNNIGNFDRVSEMVVRAIQWASMNIKAEKKLSHRKKIELVDEYGQPIMKRDWY